MSETLKYIPKYPPKERKNLGKPRLRLTKTNQFLRTCVKLA